MEPHSFARDVVAIPDVDGDGIAELAVGGTMLSSNKGAVWVLRLTAAGGVKSYVEYSGFSDVYDNFGFSGLTVLPDLDYNGYPELLVGAVGDGSPAGACSPVLVAAWAPE